MVVAGDINLDDAEALVLKWFSEIPKGNPVDRITVPTPRQTALKKTITELIYIPNEVEDDYYILQFQIASFENDASPSKPILYKIMD